MTYSHAGKAPERNIEGPNHVPYREVAGEKPKGTGKNWHDNVRTKIRSKRQKAEAEKGLRAAAAPEAAAAAPAEEQPQNPDAAKHQGKVLQDLQAKVAAEGGQPKMSASQRKQIRKQRNKEKHLAKVAAASGESTQAATSSAAGQTQEAASPGADPSSSSEPLPWRQQQKQFLAAQTAKAEPSTEGESKRDRRAGFRQKLQGKAGGPGRPPHTAPLAEREPAPLTAEQIQKQEEEEEAFVRYAR